MHQQADSWEAAQDNRYIFLRCYSLMTGNMLEAIGDNRFHDPVWVAALLEHFANYYFHALDAYEAAAETVPAAWSHAHDATCRQQLHVLQYLLLGVNAHINYDLVLVLYDRLHLEWEGLPGHKRQQRQLDHNTVNDIIAATIDMVQDEVVEKHTPSMDIVDKLMGRVDEWLLSELISSWRSHVWQKACTMLSAESAAARELIRQQTEQEVLHRAKQLLIW